MSKIYRPSMTAEEAFDVLENDAKYAKKIGELRGIVAQIDGRVGLVKTQGEADKLLSQAESEKAMTAVDRKALKIDETALETAKLEFAEEMKRGRKEVDALHRRANSKNAEAEATEQRVSADLDDRGRAVENRENRVGERETNMKAAEEAVAAEKKAFAAILKAATDGLKALR